MLIIFQVDLSSTFETSLIITNIVLFMIKQIYIIILIFTLTLLS